MASVMGMLTVAAEGWVATLVAAPVRLGGGGALDVSLGRIMSALFICLMLAGVAGLILRRAGGRVDWASLRGWKTVPIPRIKVIETRRISTHADVCLFRCDDEDFLVLSSATTQRVLRRSPARDRPA